MSILDLVPESDRAEVLRDIANERPFEPASANEIALRWCVMKLLGELSPPPETEAAAHVIATKDAEIAAVREMLAQERLSAKAAMMGKLEKNAMLGFASLRLEAHDRLLDAVRTWVSVRGSAAERPDDVAEAFHACVARLEEIAAEERKLGT